MARHFKRQEEEEKLAQRFEASLKNQSNELFDIPAYEAIIDYYVARFKYRKALVAAEQALELYPFSNELMPVKAHILSCLKRDDEALVLLEHAQNIHPHDLEIYFTMGSVLAKQGKHKEALAIYLKTLTFAEEEVDEIYYQIGTAYQNLQKYEHAMAAYKKAIAINIDHEDSLYELAYCLDMAEQLHAGVLYYKKLIDKNPYYAVAWHNLGVVYDKLEKYELAVDAYEYAVAIDDTFTAAYFNMGRSCLNTGQHIKALDAFKKTMTLEGPSSEVYCAIGTVYEHLCQYNLGIKYFQKSTKMDSFCDEAWFGIGNCLAKSEKWHQALPFLNKAIKLDSRNIRYWKVTADTEFKIGNVISSVIAYEEANDLDPEDKEVWLNWSLIYYKQGEYKKAIRIMREGLTHTPQEYDLICRMIVYLIEDGNVKEALLLLQQIVKPGLDESSGKPPGRVIEKVLTTIMSKFKQENP